MGEHIFLMRKSSYKYDAAYDRHIQNVPERCAGMNIWTHKRGRNRIGRVTYEELHKLHPPPNSIDDDDADATAAAAAADDDDDDYKERCPMI
jgi:hypothetical protein